jgi:hypothetical protein
MVFVDSKKRGINKEGGEKERDGRREGDIHKNTRCE